MKKTTLIERELAEALEMWNKFEGPMEVDKISPPKVGELRALNSMPSLYLLLAEEACFHEEKIFKALIFTEDVILGYLGRGTPILGIPSQRLLLVGLPLWVYLLEDFLSKYSYPIAIVLPSELESYLQFAESSSIPNTSQGIYIKKIAQILAPFNTSSLLDLLEDLESVTSFLLIEPEPVVFDAYQGYQYLAVAGSKFVYKGKNWLGLVERLEGKVRLILYLPQNLLGERVKIYLKDKLLFEGELTSDKVIVEPLPEYMDYSFLEEDLYVQI